MNRQALFVLILLPGMAQAVICRSVDANGVVSYTEVPAASCPEPVKLPKYSTFESRPVAAGVDDAEGKADPEENVFKGYQSISILQPEADGVVRSNEGKVPVAIKLEGDIVNDQNRF